MKNRYLFSFSFANCLGRRGAEPTKVTMDDYGDASSNRFIDEEDTMCLDEEEKFLVNHLKITWIVGKGNNSVVPVMFPSDIMQACNMLVAKENGSLANVNVKNEYLFPSTKQSEGPVSAWHALRRVVEVNEERLTKPNSLNATGNRHRISSLFAKLEVPESMRDRFYKVNKNILGFFFYVYTSLEGFSFKP